MDVLMFTVSRCCVEDTVSSTERSQKVVAPRTDNSHMHDDEVITPELFKCTHPNFGLLDKVQQ